MLKEIKILSYSNIDKASRGELVSTLVCYIVNAISLK